MKNNKVLDTKINLCDNCAFLLPECINDLSDDDITYGDGIGNDNIIECKNYSPINGGCTNEKN